MCPDSVLLELNWFSGILDITTQLKSELHSSMPINSFLYIAQKLHVCHISEAQWVVSDDMTFYLFLGFFV